MNHSDFDWQTAEDENLNPSAERRVDRLGHRRLWLLIAFITFAGLATFAAVRLFTQEQRKLDAQRRQDVQSGFALWQRAVAQQDSELYAHLLANTDRRWQRTQKRLFEKDLIWSRPFFSLALQDGAKSIPEITLSPDWEQATVAYEQQYRMRPVSESAASVRLQHTAVFALRNGSWIQVAPDGEFWGERVTFEGDLLVVEYPERDAALAQRIGRQLDADIQAVCQTLPDVADGKSKTCGLLKPFMLKMSTDPQSLAVLDSTVGMLHPGLVFELPAPTLAGLPLDESSFQAFYQGYTQQLLEQVRSAVNFPTPLPQQVIRTLCYDHPRLGPHLYEYDPALSTWSAGLPQRSFDFLLSLPGDQGLILNETGYGSVSGHPQLIRWRAGAEELLLDGALMEAPYRVINTSHDTSGHLLLRTISANQLTVNYSSLDLRSCTQAGCTRTELPGYPVWSPGGRHALVQIGSEIYLADAAGQIKELLGVGYNPFWLDDETAAYIRSLDQESRQVTTLVLNPIASPKEQLIFDTRDLVRAAAKKEGELSLRYVSPSPADPRLLLVHASGLHEFAGQYFIFSVRLPDRLDNDINDGIRLLLQRQGSLVGDASQVTPTGYLPFSSSPDGRWLLSSELSGRAPVTRTFILYDFIQERSEIISTAEAVFPAQFPSYDWSDDGRWLVIAGDGYFRLLAPESGFEQLVAHEFDSCAFTRWSR